MKNLFKLFHLNHLKHLLLLMKLTHLLNVWTVCGSFQSARSWELLEKKQNIETQKQKKHTNAKTTNQAKKCFFFSNMWRLEGVRERNCKFHFSTGKKLQICFMFICLFVFCCCFLFISHYVCLFVCSFVCFDCVCFSLTSRIETFLMSANYIFTISKFFFSKQI